MRNNSRQFHNVAALFVVLFFVTNNHQNMWDQITLFGGIALEGDGRGCSRAHCCQCVYCWSSLGLSSCRTWLCCVSLVQLPPDNLTLGESSQFHLNIWHCELQLGQQKGITYELLGLEVMCDFDVCLSPKRYYKRWWCYNAIMNSLFLPLTNTIAQVLVIDHVY